MTGEPGILEHVDRVRRVRSVACPRCGQPKGKPCRTPDGQTSSYHHAARYEALYRKRGRK